MSNVATQNVAPLAKKASPYLSWKSMSVSGGGGSVVPLFAECFELGVDLGHFGPRATSRSRRQNWQLRLLVGWALAPNAPAENPVWCYLLIYLFCAKISERCSSFVGGDPGGGFVETPPLRRCPGHCCPRPPEAGFPGGPGGRLPAVPQAAQ